MRPAGSAEEEQSSTEVRDLEIDASAKGGKEHEGGK